LRIRSVWLLIPVLLFASIIGSGFSENLDVGPFNVEFRVNLSEKPAINLSAPIKGIGFDEYGFRLKTGILRSRVIDVAIDDYQNSTDVSETKLMDSITNMIKSNSYKLDWDNKVTVGGITGIRGKIREKTDSLNLYQIAAFSPDGKGNKGNIVVFIRSFFPDDVTDSFLRDLKILRMNNTSNLERSP
jgi:hypothetical protein